jgi:hypothetical protein
MKRPTAMLKVCDTGAVFHKEEMNKRYGSANVKT